MIVALTLLTNAKGESNHEESKSMENTIQIAELYYDAFRSEAQFQDVPMAENLRFSSPRFQLETSDDFLGALERLQPQVKGLEILNQLKDDTSVITFYNLDLGAPEGPIPMAEHLHVEHGELVAVELIFDSARLPKTSGEEIKLDL